MNSRVFGVSDDPFDSAREDVASNLALSPRECYARFLDILDLSDHLMRTRPPEEWFRIWKTLDTLDNPGRWWDRVPPR